MTDESAPPQAPKSVAVPATPTRAVPNRDFPSTIAQAAAPQEPSSPEVDLRRWRQEGYPSEYAYAQAVGALKPKLMHAPPEHEIFPDHVSEVTTDDPHRPSSPSPLDRAAGVPAEKPLHGVTGSRGRGIVEGIGLGVHNPSASPWATQETSQELHARIDLIDTHLTSLISEKTSLFAESNKLHQRGGKTLKDRSRLNTIEIRLKELDKDIASDRRQLASRPP